MVRKVKVAIDSRSNDDTMIIARTDARTALGLDEALRRAEAYAEAGADILFIEAPESEDELAQKVKRYAAPEALDPFVAPSSPGAPTARRSPAAFSETDMPN